MLGFKKTVLAAVSVVALSLAPLTPAAAGGLIVPWILGRHVVAAAVGLATLPFAIASAALFADQPAAPYPPTPEYGGGPSGVYAPPNYYARPPTYYAPPPAYYAGPQYYRPAGSYARSVPRFYEPSRGYYAPRTRYTGAYGAHVPYQSGRFAYRRR